MDYVKMPQILSSETIKAMAGNLGELKGVLQDNSVDSCWKNNDVCCPKKVKFILFLNNVVIININAIAEEDKHNPPPKPC